MTQLYLVPTPIGNLEDISLRSLRILKEVSVILTEDTRTARKLLNHYEIKTPLEAYHMHNEHKRTSAIITSLKEGVTHALISDAGTPGISDPGYLLVRACVEEGVEITCLPGATAFVPALVLSGMALHTFTFVGFLPVKKGRNKKLQWIKKQTETLVLYESPHKLLKTLTDLRNFLGNNRPCAICKEISKIHESVFRGSLIDAQNHFEQRTIKGEFVIVIGDSPTESVLTSKEKKVNRDESQATNA